AHGPWSAPQKKTPSAKHWVSASTERTPSDRRGIGRKSFVLRQHLFQRRHDGIGGSVGRGENAPEVLPGRGVERRPVRLLHAQELRQGVERLAAADGHVARQLLLVAVDEHG